MLSSRVDTHSLLEKKRSAWSCSPCFNRSQAHHLQVELELAGGPEEEEEAQEALGAERKRWSSPAISLLPALSDPVSQSNSEAVLRRHDLL